MKAAASPVLLELHLAVNQAARNLRRRDRARLELAGRAVILAAEHGELLLDPPTPAAVLEQLRRLVRLAIELRVDWAEVVAVVNRGE